jgi:hypothetical protein
MYALFIMTVDPERNKVWQSRLPSSNYRASNTENVIHPMFANKN